MHLSNPLSRKILLSGFLLFLAFAKCWGQEFTPLVNSDSFVKSYQEAVAAQESLKADYVQNKHLSYMQTPVESSGKFYALGQEKIRWEQTAPQSHILIMANGKAYVIKEGSTEEYNLEKNRQFRTINEMMTRVMSGEIADNPDFEISFFETTSEVKVVLVPSRKMMRKFIASVELVLDKKTYLLNDMIMREADGNYTEIIFSNQKANLPLEMSIFEPTN